MGKTSAVGRRNSRLRKRLIKPHPTHRMGKWGVEIMSPRGTPRFYTVRRCKKCGYGQMYSNSGVFNDYQMGRRCYADYA